MINTGTTDPRPRQVGCRIDDCVREHCALGLCKLHYERRNRVDPAVNLNHLPPEQRFWAQVACLEGDVCWLWLGAKVSAGYGAFGLDYRQTPAHRYAYELLVGPIPDGLELDHLCRVRSLVNPAHLEPVTGAENKRRAAAFITHCPQGHLYDVENTYINGRGARMCRRCMNEKRAGAKAVAV